MAGKSDAFKRTWARIKSSLCSTPRDSARSPEASPLGDNSGQAVPVPEQGSSSFTDRSDKFAYDLWNKAYDELEQAESKLVGNYVEVLAKELAKDITEARYEETRDDSVGHPDERKYLKDLTARVFVELNVSKAITTVDKVPSGSVSAELDQISTSILARLKDPTKRQMFLEMLVGRGQLRVKKTERIAKTAGSVAEQVLNIKPVVDLILQIPQAAPAALPWAGICLGIK